MHRRQILGWLGGALLLTSLLLLGGWNSQSTPVVAMPEPLPTVSIALSPPPHRTLADQRLQAAQTLLRYLPEEADGYNQLAAAYLLKSRETGDFSYATKAELALEQSFKFAPENGEAQTLQLILLLNEHRFQAARELAEQLQPRFPQDPQIETALVDALVELGDYTTANANVQVLLRQHPSATVYARLSYLQSLQGDSTGAIAAMQRAVKIANPRDREGLAWYHVHLGLELLNTGKRTEAEHEIDQSLQIFPEYPLALVAKARVRLATQDWQQAEQLYRRAEEQIPLPDTAMALGDLYQRLGNPTAAQRQYDLVEFLAQSGGDAFRQAYAHQLVLFWADQGTHLQEALQLIQHERLTRSDIYTFDALAWCLFKLDRLSEAKAAIDQALRLNTPDARILYHAGLIYHACAADTKAAQFLQRALQINPIFHPLQSDVARQLLTRLASS